MLWVARSRGGCAIGGSVSVQSAIRSGGTGPFRWGRGILRRFAALSAGVFLVAACAGPSEPVPNLRVGTSGDYAPFSIASDSASGYEGFDIEVARAFARDHGRTIEWVPFRWADLSADFAEGRFDVVMSGVTVRVDRSVLGRFSVPVLSSGAVLLYDTRHFASEAALRFEDFDREGVRVAVNRGGHLEKVARASFGRAAIETRGQNAAVREALAAGEVPVIVTDTLEAPGWQAGLAHVARFGPFSEDRKAYWVHPADTKLARELDRWLLLREADGTLPALRRHWFGTDESRARARPASALVAAVDERLALMPWVAESKRRSGAAIEDREREARVLDAAFAGVARAAASRGVEAPEEQIVRAFYRAQIEAAKAIQRRTLAGPPTREATAEDLSQRLRPALLRIGDRMAALLVALEPGATTHADREALRRALAKHGLGAASAAAALRSFEALASGVVEPQ